MSELFKTTPKSFPPKELMIIIIFRKTTKTVSEEWFMDKINAKLPPTNRRILIKREKSKEEKTRKNIMKTINYWNDWNSQLHWNKLECVDPNTQDCRFFFLRLTSFTLNMEIRHVILLDIKN